MQSTNPRDGAGALAPRAPEWSTSMYCARVLRECVTAWRMVRFQPYNISFEDQVMAISTELSIYYFKDRPWLYRGSSSED